MRWCRCYEGQSLFEVELVVSLFEVEMQKPRNLSASEVKRDRTTYSLGFRGKKYPHLVYASHHHAHLLTCCSLKQSYVGIVPLEVFVRRLRIRIVSQGVVYVFSVGLGGCLLDRMCFFTYPCGYTLYIFLYVSFD